MITRNKGKVTKPQANLSTKYLLRYSSLPTEPTCFTQENKDKKWREAMQGEYNSLIQKETWTLVPTSISRTLFVANGLLNLNFIRLGPLIVIRLV